MSELKRFFKHSSIYAVGNVLNRIGAFVLLPVYTNYLSVSEYGIVELFYVISSIVSGVLAIGLAHATLRFYFEYDEEEDRKEVVSSNYIGSLAITVIGVTILSFAAPLITAKVINSEEYTIGIYIIFATLVFELSSQICFAYIRAIEYSVFFVIISLAKLIVQVSINTYLVMEMHAGVVGVLTGNLITVFIGWLVLSGFTLHKCGFKFDFHKFKPVLTYSFPFLLSTILGVISLNVDKFILNYLISLEALGLYALAYKFSLIIEQLVGEPFSRSYGAFRYSIMKNPDASDTQAQIVKYLLMVTVVAALGISFFVKDLLHIMSEKDYWPAASLVPVVMIAAAVKIMTYPAQSGILFAKQTRYLFYFTAMSAIVSAVGNFILISIFGVIGACIALVITESFVLIATHLTSQKYFYVRYEFKKMGAIVLLTFLFYMLSLLLSSSHLITSIAIKATIYIAFIYALYTLPILNSSEKETIKQFLRSKILRAKYT